MGPKFTQEGSFGSFRLGQKQDTIPQTIYSLAHSYPQADVQVVYCAFKFACLTFERYWRGVKFFCEVFKFTILKETAPIRFEFVFFTYSLMSRHEMNVGNLCVTL